MNCRLNIPLNLYLCHWYNQINACSIIYFLKQTMYIMKVLRQLLLIMVLLSGYELLMVAQDTTVVQTLNFGDITKRRDTYLFPDSSHHFRKILMSYTLKCDPQTTQDSYDCGEWDYLTYSIIYDHRGKADSTFKSGYNFKIGNTTPDSVKFTWQPTYSRYRTYQYQINYTNTNAYASAQIGNGSQSTTHPLGISAMSGKAQYLWKADEMLAAGLVAGNITGLQIDVAGLGSGTIANLRIKFKHSTLDSLNTSNFEKNGFTEVYYKNVDIDEIGWRTLPFYTPFAWNGTSNVIVEFSFEIPQGATAADYLINGHNTTQPLGGYIAGTDYCINLNPNGGNDYVNLGTGPNITGNAPRTIEAWGYARAFNDGGLFQAGPGGLVGGDFSLRTTTTLNQWRAQMWGTPDFDATLTQSQNAWHHYALVYNGTTARLYYDGVQKGSKTYGLETGISNVLIGQWYGSFFNGMADEVRVWNDDLSLTTLREWKDRNLTPDHPNYADLRAYYNFNEGSGIHTTDLSPNQLPNGNLINSAWWKKIKGEELFRNFTPTNWRPNVIFEQGSYDTTLDSIAVDEQITNPPIQIVLFDNEGAAEQIADNSALNPATATDTLVVWASNRWTYTYNTAGEKIDSVWVNADSTIYKLQKTWYSPTVAYEVGRFITPYGIGLDLGDNGFRWQYDVTDYAFLLQDSVDIESGNQQELIDLKFIMIEGTPPANMTKMHQLWNQGVNSYRYADLDADNVLSAQTVDVQPNADKLKVKTLITGHGHESNTGAYPHCCEWKDNTHYLRVNNQIASTWHIWRDDCADNPVYPQGGTWPGSREGWCPGDVVPANEIWVSDYITDENQITLDYDITPVPASNAGMGNGNYVMSMQLFEYEAPNHNIDAEIYDVRRPNDWQYYSRINPICYDPVITLRNSGATPLTSVDFQYQTIGGNPETYTWTGSLDFGEQANVVLPISNENFWQGDSITHVFVVNITGANGTSDEYADNNTYRTQYTPPTFYANNFRIRLRTNNLPQENHYTIRDINGDIVFSRDDLTANTTYTDTMALAPGCYTFEIYDTGLDGLAYWAYPEQGNGYVRFMSLANTSTLKNFEAEFGRYIHYAFTIGEGPVNVPQTPTAPVLAVYPNPNTGSFQIDLADIADDYQLEVINPLGQKLLAQTITPQTDNITVNLGETAQGVYIVRLYNGHNTISKKVIVR